PNVAGATVLSLGCQHAQATILQEEIKKRDAAFDKPLFVFEQQSEGTEQELMQKAIKATFAGLTQANQQTRQPAPLDKLCIGLECGGSDGFSGISANPALGYVSDMLVTMGGSVILAEFPELCGLRSEGTEQELMQKAIKATFAGLTQANQQTRQPAPLDKLCIGLECGGSDGFSGISANPALGYVSDMLVTMGGSVILAEFPELCGV